MSAAEGISSGTDERTMVTTYDAAGNVLTQTDGINTTTYTYDDNNRKLTETDGNNHTTTYTYDDNGNVETVTDAEGKVTTYYYDGQYQQEKTVDANGNTTWSIKDAGGRDVVSIDGVGNLTQYGYDSEGRFTRTVAPDGGVTHEWYDVAGNRIAFIDPEGNTTWYDYNELHQLIAETDQTGATKSYTYDDAGRLATLTEKLGRVQIYTYDNADRLTSVEWKNAASGSVVETLSYAYYDDGKLHTAANSEGAYTFTYDGDGRLKTQTDPYGLVLTYTYNDANDRVQVTDSKGGTTTSSYDAAHNLTSRTQTNSSGNGVRVEFSYNNRNDRTEARRYDAASGGTKVSSTTYATDDGGRQTGQTHKDGSGATLITYTNSYDNANRITSENRNGSVQNFTYDDNSQVTTDGSGNTYTTDKNGNRNMSGYSTGDANRLTSDGTWNYTYDAEGNNTKKVRISDGYTFTYGYDHRNQMTWVEERVTDGGTLVQRLDVDYDVFGNVIRETKVVGSSTTITKRSYEITNTGSGYTKSVHIEWATMDASGNITVRYLAGDGEGEKYARFDAAGSETWILQDRLGTVRDLLSATGTIDKSIRFDGFGNILFETGSGIRGEYGFHGMRHDPVSNTYTATWRRTFVGSNRWTSVDPIGTAGGDANFYRLAGNGGVNGTDRNGLDFITRTKKDADQSAATFSQNGMASDVVFVLPEVFLVRTRITDAIAVDKYARSLDKNQQGAFLMAVGAHGGGVQAETILDPSSNFASVILPKFHLKTIQRLQGTFRYNVGDIGGTGRHFSEGAFNYNIDEGRPPTTVFPPKIKDKLHDVNSFPLFVRANAFALLQGITAEYQDKSYHGFALPNSFDVLYIERPEFGGGGGIGGPKDRKSLAQQIGKLLKPGGIFSLHMNENAYKNGGVKEFIEELENAGLKHLDDKAELLNYADNNTGLTRTWIKSK